MEEIAAVKRMLGEVFNMRDLGEATYFLGMKVYRNRKSETLKLTQSKLTGELLQRYEMEAARGRNVPMSPGEKMQRDGEPPDHKKFPYSELVGSLLYLSLCTRPDIAQSVGVLARYMATPTKDHWRLALGVVRYLSVTSTCGLKYGGKGPELTAYCDADYAGDVDSRRSTTDYVFIMHGGAVS
jgi:hypothetical protein